MKTSLTLASLIALAPLGSQAATFTLDAPFYFGTDPGTFVFGTGTISYEAPSALADGNYAWSSLVNPTVTISFIQGSTFTQDDFTFDPVSSGLGVQVVSGKFIFTTLTANTPSGGSADFLNSMQDELSTEPVGPGATSALFMTSFGPLGIYGFTGGAVPEPSTYGLALGGLALAVAALRRRKK